MKKSRKVQKKTKHKNYCCSLPLPPLMGFSRRRWCDWGRNIICQGKRYGDGTKCSRHCFGFLLPLHLPLLVFLLLSEHFWDLRFMNPIRGTAIKWFSGKLSTVWRDCIAHFVPVFVFLVPTYGHSSSITQEMKAIFPKQSYQKKIWHLGETNTSTLSLP